MADGPTDLLPTEDVADTDGTGAPGLVRARIEALIVAARDLSETCADLADALRPVPGSDPLSGSEMDDPLTMDFGRLRAERTAALLDEAAAAARGTFGLLGAARTALEQQVRAEAGRGPTGGGPTGGGPTGGGELPGGDALDVPAEHLLPPPAGASTWPDAFQEMPPRSVPDDAEEDLAAAARLDQFGGTELGADFDQVEPDHAGAEQVELDATSDHAPFDHPTSDHATSDHAPSDHPTSDHPTSDHPTSDHATSDHATAEPDASTDDEGLSDSEPPEGLAAVPAALAGWVVVDPDDEDGSEPVALEHRPTGPLPVAAAASGPTMLTVHTDRDDDPDGSDFEPEPFGEAASSEPRSLSLVPPLPPSEVAETEDALGADPLSPDLLAVADLPEPAAETTAPDSPVETPLEALEATGSGPWIPEPAAWVPEPEWEPVGRSVWAVEPPAGASAAGSGIPVFPLTDEPDLEPDLDLELDLDLEPEPPPMPIRATPAEAALPAEPVDDPAAAVVARQVEAARRHLQAALVVTNGTAAPQLGSLLTAVEQVLTAVTDLARETRGVLDPGLAERTFPGESRFLCSGPWETAALVGREAYPDEAASPGGLAKLLRALGYDAHSVTSASGVAGVQIRSGRYAAHLALVEPASGGRQRWSGALEWIDGVGASRTWAETLGPVELEEEELARRVDELVRRSIGPA